MRIPSLTIRIGLSAALGIVLLNTQVQSLARSEAVASREVEDIEVIEDAEDSEDVPAFASGLRTGKEVLEEEHAAARSTTKPIQVQILPAINQTGIARKHKLIANEVLMALPENCRNTLKNFYVKYEKQKSRGLAGKSVMILDGTVPDAEFRALFVHETAHNWDIGCLRGTPEAGKSQFADGDEPIYRDDPSIDFYKISWISSSQKRQDARSEDFVSGYAAHDIFEDFAESFAYFVLQNDTFLERARDNEALARKYVWFRDVLFEGTIPQLADGTDHFTRNVPWDVTKLAYEWKM